MQTRMIVVLASIACAVGCAAASNNYNAAPVTAATGNNGGIATASAGPVTMNATGGQPEVAPSVNGVSFNGDGVSGSTASNRASTPGASSAPSNQPALRSALSPGLRERIAANGPATSTTH